MLDTLLGRQDIEREERNASKSSIKDSARVCVCVWHMHLFGSAAFHVARCSKLSNFYKFPVLVKVYSVSGYCERVVLRNRLSRLDTGTALTLIATCGGACPKEPLAASFRGYHARSSVSVLAGIEVGDYVLRHRSCRQIRRIPMDFSLGSMG